MFVNYWWERQEVPSNGDQSISRQLLELELDRINRKEENGKEKPGEWNQGMRNGKTFVDRLTNKKGRMMLTEGRMKKKIENHKRLTCIYIYKIAQSVFVCPLSPPKRLDLRR